MASVADYLTRQRGDIVRRYAEECARLPPAQGLTYEELTDTLPEYLGALADLCREGHSAMPAAEVKRRLERTHVRVRLRAGYTEEEALAEYVTLGRLIVGTWEGAPPEERPSGEDTQRLFEGLQSAMDAVVQGFTGYTLEDRQREKRFLRRMDALATEALGEDAPLAPFEQRLEPLLHVIQDAMRTDGVALFLVEEDGHGLPLTASAGLGAAPPGSYRTHVGAPSFVGQLAGRDEPLNLPDVPVAPLELLESTRTSGLGMLLGVRISSHGKLVGVLHVGVRQVRPFTPRDERFLETLVEHLAGILGHARLLERVRRAEAYCRLASQAITDALWDWDLRTGSLGWSQGAFQLLGHRPETLGTRASGWTEHLHPEDRQRVVDGIHAVIDGGGTRWSDEYRFRHGSGRYLVVKDSGVVERDAEGKPARMVGAMQDVTLRRQAEEARQRSEARYRTLFEGIDEGFCILHVLFDEAERPLDCRYIEINPAFERQTGMRDVLGKTIRELAPGIEPFWFDIYGRVALTGEPTRFENHAASMGRWFSVYAFRVGKPQAHQVAVLFTDITQRKQAEAQAEAERQKLHDVFQQAPVAICILEGPRHTFTFANPPYLKLVPGPDILGKPLVEALPGMEEQGFDKLLDQVVASGTPFVGNAVPVKLSHHAEGEVDYMNFVYQPMRDAQGQVRGVVVCAFEVTDQVLARRQAEGLSAQLEAILQSFPEPVYVADATGLTRANAAGLSMVGAKSPAQLERSIALLHEKAQVRRADTGAPLAAEESPLARALQGHTSFLEFIIRDLTTGRDRVMRSAAAPVHVGEQVVGGVCVCTDITERTAAERALRERTDFEEKLIGIVGHDLRSPLQSVLLSATALLRQEELDVRAMRNVTRIRTSAERAHRMIRDLLDFTQARLGGGIPLERRSVDVPALVREVVDEMEANFPERQVQVALEGESQAELDRDRMAQVLTNLLHNALRYSPEDTPVRVRMEVGEEALVLAVHNRGEPVPPERLPHLFQPMQRATHQEDRTGRSVGLGLFIVRHLVEAHGGSVQVASSREEGTTFTVHIPRRRSA
jgi:PAS domain S-box-containing protein